MKIIFLDIDGVIATIYDYNRAEDIFGLNPYTRHTKEFKEFDFKEREEILNKDLITKLNKICEETGAFVVIVSTWRRVIDYKTIEKMLINKGFAGKVVGQVGTRMFDDGRVSCTLRFFEDVEDITHAVVIDDDSWIRLTEEPLLFRSMKQVKPNTQIGLTDENVQEAIKYLSEPLTPLLEAEDEDNE